MKLDFIDIDEICKNLKQVTNSKIYNKNSFHPDGLFSQIIFGPLKTATCACQIYWGRTMIGNVCNTCGCDITFSNERRKRFAKIVLPFGLLNPIMKFLLIKVGKNRWKEMIHDLIFNDKIYGYLYDTNKKEYKKLLKITKDKESDIEQIPQIPEGFILYRGLDGLFEICKIEADKNKNISKVWKYIHDNMNKFYIHNILVPPPEFRPVSRSKDSQRRDEINQYLITILNYCNTMKNDNLNTMDIDGISQISIRTLQKHIDEYYDFIFSKFSKKTGLIRGSILGKRVDFSGRAVICPDPTLKIDECRIPYIMAMELYKLDVANMLIDRRVCKRYDTAISIIDKCIDKEDDSLFDVVSLVCNGKYIMLNRQPTLHRMSILSFKMTVIKDFVIKVHPLVCEPYNADFDGDQMAIYRPLYDSASKECEEKLSVKNNLISPSTFSSVVSLNQDIILGIYLLTQENKNEKIIYDGIDTYNGRVIFNECLPDDYPFINYLVDKKILRVIVDDLTRSYSSDVVAQCLDKIKDVGFKYTTKFGCTMSLHGMKEDTFIELRNKIFDDKLTWMQQLEMLQSNEVRNIVKNEFPYSVFIESGSRGSWDQVNQIILSRGYISDFDGNIINKPIKNSLVAGLTKDEFFLSCYGSRKGLLDTALNTGVSGYLTRKLVYCAVNLELSDSDDCGTTTLYNVSIGKSDTKLAKSLIGRYYLNGDKYDIITYDNYDKFCGKTISIRSPIFCKSKQICKKCYGNTSQFLHSKYVGVIAAQSLGEVSTQLVLRTFHTSGVAKLSEQRDSKQKDIANDLTNVKKLLHVSSGVTEYNDLLMQLFKIYSEYKFLLLVHFECIVCQMMRYNNKAWRTLPDRESKNYTMVSIEAVPHQESWLLGLAFSKPKTYVIDGILDDDTSTGVLERIMVNNLA